MIIETNLDSATVVALLIAGHAATDIADMTEAEAEAVLA
jgi:hypothetical protein